MECAYLQSQMLETELGRLEAGSQLELHNETVLVKNIK